MINGRNGNFRFLENVPLSPDSLEVLRRSGLQSPQARQFTLQKLTEVEGCAEEDIKESDDNLIKSISDSNILSDCLHFQPR